MRRASLLLLPLLLACSRVDPAPAAPTPAAAAAPELTAADARRFADEVAHELDAHYVLPDVGTRMAAAIRDKSAHGGYDALGSAAAFAHTVTDDMRAVSHDRHALLERAAAPEAASAEDAEWERMQAENRATAGLGPVTRVAGNVAVVTLRSFEPLERARDAIATRMTEVADADALVFDLRENSGGDPETVAFVASYVFDATPAHLNDLWWRDTGGTESYFTLRDVPGRRFGPKKPVVVLTSKKTFSAAEELAYDLQSLHRAVVVGETTAGGAHPVTVRKISPVLTLRVPTARAINPYTKTDWEGTGVAPDVPAGAGDALAAAEKWIAEHQAGR